MKFAATNLYDKAGITSDRTRNIVKHIGWSFAYRGGSIVASFLLVPLTINYLDTENYGIWLTVSSFIAWFSFFDIGLGNGLRNKFGEAKAKGDMSLARSYVSTAYFAIGAISLLLAGLFIGINYFVDWTRVFNTSAGLQRDLSRLMPIIFGFFCLELVAKLITTIYAADQHHSMQGKVNFCIQVGSLLLIWIMINTTDSSLLLFGTIFSVLPVLILLFLNIYAFAGKYKIYKPTIKLFSISHLKSVFGLGITFFIIQISGIVLYSTDNFIISKLFSPAEVVPYSLAYKYISIAIMIFGIIAAPYWSSITDAWHREDHDWIKRSMQSFQKISFGLMGVIIIMTLVSEWAYFIWIGDKVEIPFSLTALMAVFFAASAYVTPYTMFLNGTGKIKIQAWQSILSAIINIPLAIFFATTLGLGVNGVILATIVCFLPSVILSRIQYSKIINNHAYGIWNK